jgi:hypothetical protein
MALLTPIFLENDQTSQNAEELRNLTRAMFQYAGGVGNGFLVTQRQAGANMSVDVYGPSNIIIEGTETPTQGFYALYNDAPVNLPIAAADGSNPRIDTVVVYIKDSYYSGTDDEAVLEVITGTPAGSPVAPDPASLGYKNYHVLAHVSVPANDTTITNAQITDLRGHATAIAGIAYFNSNSAPPYQGTGQVLVQPDTQRLLLYNGTAYAPPKIGPYVCTSGTRPTAVFEGLHIYETDTDRVYVYNGSTWVYLYGGTNPYYFHAYLAADISRPQGLSNASLASEKSDRNGNYASSAYTAPVTGDYAMSATLTVASTNTTDRVYGAFYINGDEYVRGSDMSLTSGQFGAVHVSAVLPLVAGDIVTLGLFSVQGPNPISLQGGADGNITWWIGRKL